MDQVSDLQEALPESNQPVVHVEVCQNPCRLVQTRSVSRSGLDPLVV